MRANYFIDGEADALEYADSVLAQTKDGILRTFSPEQQGIVHELLTSAFAEAIEEGPMHEVVGGSSRYSQATFCRRPVLLNPFNEQEM